ncbi:BSD domain-containing protein 1-like [Neltuma alba]|uniref:BSD domain-containing protein 1-like n=1 Tax=Neltuma alba TaxID=207710 RepID=UPI0010A4E289|nr:BSD domain-containing protein 1-like [Prosopis alba]
MDFFKAVFSDDPPPPPPVSHGSREHDPDEPDPSPAPVQSSDPNNAWNFGGLFQTLASKSESVIGTYRRDLEEFSSGLRKETAIIREAASRAVKDLPASLDVGASVAQESLESVGQAIDDIGSSVWKSTTKIISRGRDSLLADDSDFVPSDYNDNGRNVFGKQRLSTSSNQSSDVKPYSRFDALVRALQNDVNTYVEEPEDVENYNEWKAGFELDKKGQEIQDLFAENGVIEEIYGEVVSIRIDHESFWSRYFYRMHKLKQAEDARAKLVKRAISGDEEEDLSWDFDDDDDGYEAKGDSSAVTLAKEEDSTEVAGSGGAFESVETKKVDSEIENDANGFASESGTDGGYKSEVKDPEHVASNAPGSASGSGDKLEAKYQDQAASEVKTDNIESCKDSDISVVSSQPSMPEEEDLGWDEIEDMGSNDENKADAFGTTSRIDLRKRLSSDEQEEDLSWDIEDDDEAVKS